jgi:molecular chaperone DnaJ
MGFHGFETNEDIYSSFGDIFGDIFANRYYRERQGPEPGEDLTANITVSFRDAALGAHRDVSFTKPCQCVHCNGTGSADRRPPQPCNQCGGSGRVSKQNSRFGGFFSVSSPCPACRGTGVRVTSPCAHCAGSGAVEAPFHATVTIPSGVESGSVLSLAGRGAPGRRGGPTGDLLLSITVEPDPVFERRGNDLLYKTAVPFTLLALGGEMDVPTLHGTAKMKIRPGTQSGRTLRLGGQGIASRKGTGDMLVTVEAQVPQQLTERQKELIEELRRLES